MGINLCAVVTKCGFEDLMVWFMCVRENTKYPVLTNKNNHGVPQGSILGAMIWILLLGI